jgi:hypothetical protein
MGMAGVRSLMMDGGETRDCPFSVSEELTFVNRIAYMINENSIQFNVVSKRLGSERMSFYLNEAASDIRELMMTTLEAPKPKL